MRRLNYSFVKSRSAPDRLKLVDLHNAGCVIHFKTQESIHYWSLCAGVMLQSALYSVYLAVNLI